MPHRSGLTLDAMALIFTPKFIPFFLILWVVSKYLESFILVTGCRANSFVPAHLVNVSIASYPLDLLPEIFRYGYAMPFYNLSRTVLAICFGTKNDSKS